MIKTIMDGAVAPLQTAVAPGPTARVTKATITNFGPDGVARAKQLDINYAEAQMDAEGSVMGGAVSIASSFAGATCSASTIRFGEGGGAVSASSTVYDRLAGGIHRVVDCDFSGLESLFGRVTSGTLKVTSAASDGTVVAQGTVTFAAERLSRADLVTRSSPSAAAFDRAVSLDFSGTEFLGSDIVGGTLVTQSSRSDGHVLSRSSTSFDDNGCLAGISQAVYDDASDTVRSTSEFDFSGVAFNALAEVDSGTLVITSKQATGALASTGRLTYASGVPAAFAGEIYDRETLVRRTAIDYTGVTFNQARRPINTSVAVRVTDPGGNPIMNITTDYGPDGLPVARRIDKPSGVPGVPDLVTHVDYRRAVHDGRRAVVGGSTTTTTTTSRLRVEVVRSFAGSRRCATKERRVSEAVTGAPRSYSKTYYRPDGTALKLVKVSPAANGTPASGSVTYYATDGRTVISSRRIDYTQVSYDAGGAVSGGTIAVTTSDGRGRLRSQGQVSIG